jgi:predicted HTH transcriptional regulator
MMTIEEILAGESKNVEFKENLPEKSIKYMKSVVAFANGTGGKIIFGIADKSREVVGFDKEEVFKIMDAIRELIVNAMVHRSYLDHGTIQVAVYDNRLEITSPGKLPMGQTMERMKEGYSKIRNEALAHAFAYMNLIEHWGSGIPRIIDKVKAAGLREPEFIGGEVDLRINVYRRQVDANNAIINANGTKNGVNYGVEVLNKEKVQIEKLLQIIEKNPFATQAYYAEQIGVSKRTVSRMFVSLQEKGILIQNGTKRKSNWIIKK